jgi:AraC-like DNA-binding protein
LTQNDNLMAHVASLAMIHHYRAPGYSVSPYVLPDGCEVVEIVTGGEVFFPDETGRRLRYGPGAMFWHQAHESTICETPPQSPVPYRCWSLRFEVGARKRPVPRTGVWRQIGKLDDVCTEILKLFSEGADRRLLGMYAYGTMLRQYCSVLGDEDDKPPELARILRFIDARHGCRCPIEKLVEYGRIGQAKLFRMFRDRLGCTPHEYIMNKRMAYARLLLLSAVPSIKETAAECGYDNLEVFYRNFKKCNGMTPGEFVRSRHR